LFTGLFTNSGFWPRSWYLPLRPKLQVRLYLHIKKNNGKRGFAPAAYGKNSKILPKQALVDGQVELHPEGKYHLRYTRHYREDRHHAGTR